MNITTSIRTSPEGMATVKVTIDPATRAGGFQIDTGELAAKIADTALAAARGMGAQYLPNYWDCTGHNSFLPFGGHIITHTFEYTLTTPDYGPSLDGPDY